jgi:pSer/pThr/pTyr-binding forkhead associated (FHA) protein/uncharacterized RDD family membrane protein YckC
MAKLIINPTSAARREIVLAGSTLSIGRDPGNDLVLPDAMVSRRHAVVQMRGTQFFLRDCNSSNGSLVNGDRVTERGLKDGDLVAIGATRLLFRDEAEAVSAEGSAKIVPHPSAPRLACPNCQADHGVGDQFCRQCGAQLIAHVAPKLLCPSCGSAVSRPAKFCTVCGTTLEQGLEGMAMTKPQPALSDEAVDAGPASPAVVVPGAIPTEEAPSVPDNALRAGSRTAPPSRSAPAAQLRARPTSSAHSTASPASSGLRLLAAAMDGCLVLLGQALLLAPVFYYWWSRETSGAVKFLPILLSLLLVALAALLGAFYYVYFWGLRGASPGKKALGLVVVDEDGSSPVGVGAAMLRVLGYALSALPLGLGFVLVPVTGRGLHDRMAGTRVVQRERV